MPAPVWNDLIDQSYVRLGVIQPGMTVVGTSLSTDGQTQLNQILSSLSTEAATNYLQLKQTFNLLTGVNVYTLGVGGLFNTGARANRVDAWRGLYGGVIARGGRVVSFEEFDAAATQGGGEQAAVPGIVCADTAYPLINMRVFPTPSNTPGTIELAFIGSIPQVSDFTLPYNLPDNWPELLWTALAVELYPTYARTGQSIEVLAVAAQNAKQRAVAQNAMSQPQQAAQ